MRHARLVPLIALPALAAGTLLLGTGASAQDPAARTLTFKETERGATFVHIRNTKAKPRTANRQGDLLAFTNPLVDAGGASIGKLAMSCVTTTGARDFRNSILSCSGVIALRDGTLTVQAQLAMSAPVVTGAVTGGTGAYANARGVFVSEPVSGGAQDTITLVP